MEREHGESRDNPAFSFLTEDQVAKILGFKTVASLRNARSRGEGPPFLRLNGKRICYPEAELKQYLASRMVTPKMVEPVDTLAHPRLRRPARPARRMAAVK